MTMTRRFIIQQIIETWVAQLPVDVGSSAAIATKEDIAGLSQQLASRLGEPEESQTGRWLSMLLRLYIPRSAYVRISLHPLSNKIEASRFGRCVLGPGTSNAYDRISAFAGEKVANLYVTRLPQRTA